MLLYGIWWTLEWWIFHGGIYIGAKLIKVHLLPVLFHTPTYIGIKYSTEYIIQQGIFNRTSFPNKSIYKHTYNIYTHVKVISRLEDSYFLLSHFHLQKKLQMYYLTFVNKVRYLLKGS